jgi:NADH-quinone oxidoreductase subunit N
MEGLKMRQMIIKLSPELILLVGIALVLIGEIVLHKGKSRFVLGITATLTVIASGLFVLLQEREVISLFDGSFISDPFIRSVKLLLLVGTLFVLILSFAEKVTAKGEYYLLVLAALLGAMTLVSSSELISLFVSLELLSLSAYILVGMQRNQTISSEAAWKYVIYGGVSSAFLLYGMSFFYGLTGTTKLVEMVTPLTMASNGEHQLLVYLGITLVLIGIGFKIAAVPFHMWAPDVYQGAPITITAFLAIVSKIAGFVFALRLLSGLFASEGLKTTFFVMIVPALIIIALLSMIMGNVIALKQSNLKRLLAYSSIGHAGYMLVAVISLLLSQERAVFSSLYYYFVAYLLASAGVFATLQVIAKDRSPDRNILSGLYKRSPWLAFSFTIFLLSLAGIPFTAGFIGKFTILIGAFGNSLYWLAGTMLLTTVISYYYYFRLIRQMYWQEDDAVRNEKIHWSTGAVIAISLAGTLLFGILPNVVLQNVSTWIS